jgi:hypothetical protein
MRIPLLLLLAVLGCTRAVKIAIVGGGIGAASTALHLRELIPDDLELDVYVIKIIGLGSAPWLSIFLIQKD